MISRGEGFVMDLVVVVVLRRFIGYIRVRIIVVFVISVIL